MANSERRMIIEARMTRLRSSTHNLPRALARLVSSFVIDSLCSPLRGSRWLSVSLCSALVSSFLFVAPVQGADSRWVERLAFWSWSELETLSSDIHEREQQLATLPELMLINSCLRIGLKTGYTTEEDVRWFELTLKEAAKTLSVSPAFLKKLHRMRRPLQSAECGAQG